MEGRAQWTEVREEIAERYRADPEYRAAWDKTQLRHTLASMVRDLRQQQGVSQQELAKRVGTSQAAVARLELGGAEPRLDTLERITHALNMRIEICFSPLASSPETAGPSSLNRPRASASSASPDR